MVFAALQPYNHSAFMRICILSGCDYLPSIGGIGLKRATDFIIKSQKLNLKDVSESVIDIYCY